MAKVGYELDRTGDDVKRLLDKIDNMTDDFILFRGCGDRWIDNNPQNGKESYFNFSYDELLAPIIENKVVCLMWEDKVDHFMPSLAYAFYDSFGYSGISIMHNLGVSAKLRVQFLAQNDNAIYVENEYELNLLEEEVDPLFEDWLTNHPEIAEEELTISEIKDIFN